jgi:hypothetical protein
MYTPSRAPYNPQPLLSGIKVEEYFIESYCWNHHQRKKHLTEVIAEDITAYIVGCNTSRQDIAATSSNE